MRCIVEKSILTGLLSVFASLALSFIIVPLLGGQVAGAGLFMTIFCPLAISIPASALHFTQSEKVRRAEAATKEALNKLADAYDALRVQSRTDGLTGILTRSAFMEDLDATSQSGISGALLFLDLDYFKSINDRYGHAAGDEALRCTGRILARYQGQSDFAGRLGGEEFCHRVAVEHVAEDLEKTFPLSQVVLGVRELDIYEPLGTLGHSRGFRASLAAHRDVGP
ncbi:GGDEF domain-containing protein [Rhizobium ruizarguesonis]|uniref:GGDEF domain-containing protein n=1 Tax=Rhizobium ruizarguesonis TaxID=2081791 RepID=UPI00247ABBF5|nr:GGDEF domain-containing protein [Rhizobium ruizarguesonis]